MSAGTNTADQVFMKSSKGKVAQTLPFISLHLSNSVLFYLEVLVAFYPPRSFFPPIFHIHGPQQFQVQRLKFVQTSTSVFLSENSGNRVLPRHLNLGQFLSTALIIQECFAVQITKWSAGWSIWITKILLHIKLSFTFLTMVF